MSISGNLTIELQTIDDDLNKINEIWSTLASQNNISYFLSWGWIENWLAELPQGCNVRLAVTYLDNMPILAFFVGISTCLRSKLFTIRQLTLNASGHKEYDNIWIEYNSMLYAQGLDIDLQDILKAIPLSWEEFCLPGLDLSSFPGTSLDNLSAPFEFIIDESSLSPYVDLDRIRTVDNDFLSLLRSNTRYRIRQSLHIIEQSGPIELEVPEHLEQALVIYNELIKLHQKSWYERGKPGAFSSDLFYRFHKRLIEKRFAQGEIQLLRIHSSGTTIGCLYSFVFDKKVYFYQSGFNYVFGKKVQPGMVSHVVAIKFNAAIGNMVYDFLAGEDRYKKSLATNNNKMVWGRIQRTSTKLKLEKLLLIMRSKFQYH